MKESICFDINGSPIEMLPYARVGERIIQSRDVVAGIYKATNPQGRVYIGQSKNIYNRFEIHIVYQGLPTTIFERSLAKFGGRNHIYEVLDICPQDELYKMEARYILLFETNNRKFGLNTIPQLKPQLGVTALLPPKTSPTKPTDEEIGEYLKLPSDKLELIEFYLRIVRGFKKIKYSKGDVYSYIFKSHPFLGDKITKEIFCLDSRGRLKYAPYKPKISADDRVGLRVEKIMAAIKYLQDGKSKSYTMQHTGICHHDLENIIPKYLK